METIHTKVTEQTLEKIKESGKSTYQFVQDAVADALRANEVKKELQQLEETVKKQIRSEIDKIDHAHRENLKTFSELFQSQTQKLETRITDSLNRHEGASREYNRILGVINQNLEDLLRR